MNTVLAMLGAALGKVLLSMVTSLFTEAFLKKALVYGLEKLAKKSQTDLDDKLLQAAKEAWGMEDEKGEDDDNAVG